MMGYDKIQHDTTRYIMFGKDVAQQKNKMKQHDFILILLPLEPLWNLNTYCTNWAQKCFPLSRTMLSRQGSRVFLLLPPSLLFFPLVSHLRHWRWKVSTSSEASCVVMLEGSVMLPSGTTPHVHTEDTLSNLTGWSVCLGELIVFRWGYLRRGSGREDGSKGPSEKRRKAEGYKLTMCRIFSFHMGFGEKTADTLSLFFFSVSGCPLTGPHTHTL